MPRRTKIALLILTLFAVTAGCTLPSRGIGKSGGTALRSTQPATATADFFSFLPIRRIPGADLPTPTPDPPRTIQPIRTDSVTYVVQLNDTLARIANRYAVSLEALIEANEIANPNLLTVGQVLIVPVPIIGDAAPGNKLIPDSELVNSPYNIAFDLAGFIQDKGGLLASHQEEVEGKMMTGTEIVELVAADYSVNPRLLIALLDYQTGWLSSAQVYEDSLNFPVLVMEPYRSSLYLQLTWAADTLNTGYYLWRAGALNYYRTALGKLIPASPQINAGTAALQYYFAQVYDELGWRKAVSQDGFIQTYQALYGYAFDWTFAPLVPPDLAQPTFQLPFEPGVAWIFTGGAHGGWDDGSAWAALDFAPPSEQLGCVSNNHWVVAVADGLIVRAENGAVVQDLDGDGYEQSGWTVLYMHIESRDRVAVGSYVYAGERIGHPSCEGGYSTGTHLHIARRYNGEWIAIHNSIPFVMDGWLAVDSGELYGGYLQNGEKVVEPCECTEPENMIQR